MEATIARDKTDFAAYFFINETGKWKHLATFRTTTGRSSLSGYYSFIEDFRHDQQSWGQRRSAQFGNGWIKTMDGRWMQLTEATFTGDDHPVNNIDAGVQGRAFYLVTGGDTREHTILNVVLKRPPSKESPPRR